MASNTFKFLLVATSLVLSVPALDLNLSNKNMHCFMIDIQKGDTVQIQYEVTGYNPEKFKMSIFDVNDPKTNPLHKIENLKESRFDLYATDTKQFRVCFESLDNSSKILQFEFQPHKKRTEAYANDKQLQKTLNDATNTYYTMSDIYSNFRHSLMKTETQSRILESTENKVKWCSIIKMVLMISITTVQIVFLTGLFKNYSPLGV